MPFRIKFTSDKGDDMGFTPDDADDFEIASQKVCNLLDEWPWLAPHLRQGKFTWGEIMDLVADQL